MADTSIRVGIIVFPGSNCDQDCHHAVAKVLGASAELVWHKATSLPALHAVVIPGGFSYGDYLRTGAIARFSPVMGAVARFAERGGAVLGICNGFQILTKLGLLPEGSLIENVTGRFLCRWVRLKPVRRDTPYLSMMPATFELPIAHKEGRFVAAAGWAEEYVRSGLAPLLYEDNANGSECAIAGLQDPTGRVFGLMPHPERFLFREDHYVRQWEGDAKWGWGYYFFKSIHEHIHRTRLKKAA